MRSIQVTGRDAHKVTRGLATSQVQNRRATSQLTDSQPALLPALLGGRPLISVHGFQPTVHVVWTKTMAKHFENLLVQDPVQSLLCCFNYKDPYLLCFTPIDSVL